MGLLSKSERREYFPPLALRSRPNVWLSSHTTLYDVCVTPLCPEGTWSWRQRNVRPPFVCALPVYSALTIFQIRTFLNTMFGAEFVAMKNGMECVRGLWYKLRMMGVPLTGPTYIYGDNMSVVHNTQRPESVLKKKSNSICYHAIRESVAMGESLTDVKTEGWKLSFHIFGT
jgi:hypothetical protein